MQYLSGKIKQPGIYYIEVSKIYSHGAFLRMSTTPFTNVSPKAKKNAKQGFICDLPCASETPATRVFFRSHMNNFANLEPGQIMSEIFHVLFQSFLVQTLNVETLLSFYSLPLKLLVDTRLRLLVLRTN